MKLSFWGAAQEVTGSCYELETDSGRLLIDCGLFQGQFLVEKANFKPFGFEVSKIEAVIVTHSHLDHIGRLPQLVKQGFRGKIYCTPPTSQLIPLILKDAFEVMREEQSHRGQPLFYQYEDVAQTLQLIQEVEYQEAFYPLSQVKAMLGNAGHILGSAWVEIEADGKRLIFSGDLGNQTVPLIRPLAPALGADSLILESTYGGIVHEKKGERSQLLSQIVQAAVVQKGVLMIPAFALERTQELLSEFNQLFKADQLPRLPVFLDSPLAIKITQIFRQFKDQYFSRQALKLLANDQDFFNFPGLKLCETTEESKLINQVPAPKIIIAGSGMMEGGRILHHAKRYLSDPASTLLVIGYQVRGTLGRRLLEKAKQVKIHQEKVRVQARVKAIGSYSAHADQPQLVKWVGQMKIRPQQIFITHGELPQARALQKVLQENFNLFSQIPKFGQRTDLYKGPSL